jgi:hypothetical protein
MRKHFNTLGCEKEKDDELLLTVDFDNTAAFDGKTLW